MGRSNRERRAAKKRKEHRRDPPGAANARSQWRSDPPGSDLRYLLITAARLSARGGPGDAPLGVWESVLGLAAERGSSGTALAVDGVFCECLGFVWEGGWQPAEMVRAVRRALSERHADLAATAVAAQHTTLAARPPEPWSAQLRELAADQPWWGGGRDWLGPWARRSGVDWIEALETAVAVLGVLVSVPRTQAFIAPPSEWATASAAPHQSTARVDEAVLSKVRALLAKAESTSFEHEADALTVKAQELMTRYAIDEAAARGSAGVGGRPRRRGGCRSTTRTPTPSHRCWRWWRSPTVCAPSGTISTP